MACEAGRFPLRGDVPLAVDNQGGAGDGLSAVSSFWHQNLEASRLSRNVSAIALGDLVRIGRLPSLAHGYVVLNSWNDGLAGPALNIARADQSPLRVVAGPGTGKTFALMRRVARLLHKGNEPASIFLCSFTRTAAADLTKAIGELMVEGADEVKTSTLHSHCFEVLAKEAVLSTTNRVPRPLLDLEVRFLIEDMKGD